MPSIDDSIQNALDQLADYGLRAESLDTSGRLVRVPATDDKGRKKSGWYVAHEFVLKNGSAVIVGRFGNWKLSDETQKFEADFTLDDDDLKKLREKQQADRKKLDNERKRAAADAEKRANDLWEKVRDTGNSDYLKNKGVRGYYIGYMRDFILVPLRTITGKLVGVQFIYPDGSKKFLTGTPVRGSFHIIGNADKSKQLIIAEGYATAASIFEATQIPCVVAFNTGNLLPVAQLFRKRYPDLEIIITADDDYLQQCMACNQLTIVETETCTQCGQPHKKKNAGLVSAPAAAQAVKGKLIIPAFKESRSLDKKGPTDFNDMASEQGLKAVREHIDYQLRNPPKQLYTPQVASHENNDEPPEPDWQERIQRNKDGKVIANLANTYMYLTNLPGWQGVVAYDEFASRVVCLNEPPFGGEGNRLWTDNDDTRTATWFGMYAGFSPKLSDVQKVVEIVAEDNKFHKVRDYLNGLEWDGVDRVGTWLIKYMGGLPELNGDASQADCDTHELLEQYLMAAGIKWLVGAVARVMRPGCKMDNVLILEGDQGAGKSSSLKILAGEEWFNETMVDLNDKDARQMLCGKWFIELAELDSFNKADSNKAKGFFSTSVDTYRQAYGRRMQDIPRQCVFAGTTNQHEYLRDDVNRRYWPVDCRKIDRRGLVRDRDQIWAEALKLYNEGVKWWPLPADKHLFEAEQLKRHVDDPWYEEVADWLSDPTRTDQYNQGQFKVTINAVMAGCLQIHVSKLGERVERIRVGKILHRLGWVKRQQSNKAERYYYVRGRDALC